MSFCAELKAPDRFGAGICPQALWHSQTRRRPRMAVAGKDIQESTYRIKKSDSEWKMLEELDPETVAKLALPDCIPQTVSWMDGIGEK